MNHHNGEGHYVPNSGQPRYGFYWPYGQRTPVHPPLPLQNVMLPPVIRTIGPNNEKVFAMTPEKYNEMQSAMNEYVFVLTYCVQAVTGQALKDTTSLPPGFMQHRQLYGIPSPERTQVDPLNDDYFELTETHLIEMQRAMFCGTLMDYGYELQRQQQQRFNHVDTSGLDELNNKDVAYRKHFLTFSDFAVDVDKIRMGKNDEIMKMIKHGNRVLELADARFRELRRTKNTSTKAILKERNDALRNFEIMETLLAKSQKNDNEASICDGLFFDSVYRNSKPCDMPTSHQPVPIIDVANMPLLGATHRILHQLENPAVNIVPTGINQASQHAAQQSMEQVAPDPLAMLNQINASSREVLQHFSVHPQESKVPTATVVNSAIISLSDILQHYGQQNFQQPGPSFSPMVKQEILENHRAQQHFPKSQKMRVNSKRTKNASKNARKSRQQVLPTPPVMDDDESMKQFLRIAHNKVEATRQSTHHDIQHNAQKMTSLELIENRNISVTD